MAETAKTVDFGAPDEFGAHVFRVEVPVFKGGIVRILEDYGFRGGDVSRPYEEERVFLQHSVWSAIADVARKDFNARLKEKKMPTSRWKSGKNLLDRLLGKELCVLAWAAERAKPEELPIICTRWSSLRPEERWWLFFVTAAEAGLPGDSERGWRKALYFALSDGEGILKKKQVRYRDKEVDTILLPFGGSDD